MRQRRARVRQPVRRRAAPQRGGPVHRERPAGVGRGAVAHSAALVVRLVALLVVLPAAQLAGLGRRVAAAARPGVAVRLAVQAVAQLAAVERPAVRRLAQPEAARLAVSAARVVAVARPAVRQPAAQDVDEFQAAAQPGADAFPAAGRAVSVAQLEAAVARLSSSFLLRFAPGSAAAAPARSSARCRAAALARRRMAHRARRRRPARRRRAWCRPAKETWSRSCVKFSWPSDKDADAI